MTRLTLLFGLCALAWAQPTITMTSTPVRQGSQATATVTLSGAAGASIAALQFFSSGYCGVPTFTASAVVTNSGKTLTCGPNGSDPKRFGCIVWGGLNALTDGVLATVTFTPTCPAAVPLANLLGANPAGDLPGIPITAGPVLLATLSPCDMNGDNVIDMTDVLVISAAAAAELKVGSNGAPAWMDPTGDGKIDVLDVQRIVNAAVPGGTCRTGA